MWKPGETKPKGEEQKRESKTNTSHKTPAKTYAINGPTKNENSVTKTKLSGSTMGMRFMQRSGQYPAVVKPNEVDGETSSAETKPNTRIATSSDMYGVQLIGRRAFGNFNKSVSANYTYAKNAYEGTTSSKKKKHISDDELLQLYKDHRNGRGNGLDQVDRAAAAPIGNLSSKKKRKATRLSG